MVNGFYFTKIAALGPNKEDADLSFTKGLNLLTGASNTGKSYVVKCLDYILGGGDPLKYIPEASGYNKIRAEVQTFEGKIFTLERKFGERYADPYITLANDTIDKFDNIAQNEKILLHAMHNEKNQNISLFLLNILNLNGRRLTLSQYKETKPLSFRDLAPLCIIQETKMIAEKSPVYNDEVKEETKDDSLFKLLLTGEDEKGLTQIERPAITKSRIKGMLEIINGEISRKEDQLKEIKKRCDSVSNEEVIVQIERLGSIFQNAARQLETEEKQKESIGHQISQLRSALTNNTTLLSNFEVLMKHYSSDLERLEFINEGKQGLDQLEEVNCPLCNSLVNKKILEPYTDDAPEVIESVEKEYAKTKGKKEGLSKAILELGRKIEETKTALEMKSLEFQQIDSLIANRLKPIHEVHHENWTKFLKLKADKDQVSVLEFEIAELKEKANQLTKKQSEKVITLPPRVIPENVYVELSDEIKKLLLAWGFDCNDLRYDVKNNDNIIDGLERINHGKGYRGLYLSAFLIGTMRYCIKKGRSYPNFLVLDSPLTAYMGEDKDHAAESSEIASTDIQNKFYNSLVNLPERDNLQIIVIENKAPSTSITGEINQEHFTRNARLGRYGFYGLNLPLYNR
jgi:energy-coupling factor transporter ATP-binding protein EcfA2